MRLERICCVVGDHRKTEEWTKATESYARARDAKSLDELRAFDGRALGIPCARCGGRAEDHPEFPRCVRERDARGRPLPPPPPRPTAQAVASSYFAEHVDSVGVVTVREAIRPAPGADPSCDQCMHPLNKGVHTCEARRGQ